MATPVNNSSRVLEKTPEMHILMKMAIIVHMCIASDGFLNINMILRLIYLVPNISWLQVFFSFLKKVFIYLADPGLF